LPTPAFFGCGNYAVRPGRIGHVGLSSLPARAFLFRHQTDDFRAPNELDVRTFAHFAKLRLTQQAVAGMNGVNVGFQRVITAEY